MTGITIAEYLRIAKFSCGKYKNTTLYKIKEAIEKERKEKENNADNG